MKTIVFVLDCVRYDCLGCNGNEDVYTPTIDEIARQGVVFHKHFTVSPWTNPSVASFVTGIYPHKLNTFSYKTNFPPKTKTLFDYFNQLGGGNGCFLKNFHFFGGREGINIVDYVWHTPSILRWMEENNDRDYFLYLHYWNTHPPYFTKFSAEGYFDGLHEIVSMLKSGNAKKVNKVRQLYQHSVERASEEFIYSVMEKLDKLGSLDDATIIITADHGESFGEREDDSEKVDVFGMHGRYLYEEVLHIPLIIRSRSLPCGVNIDKLSRSIDVMPTILSLYGWEPDQRSLKMNGRSLFDVIDGKEGKERESFFMTTYLDRFDKDVVSESFEKYGYRYGKWKLIYNKYTRNLELYDLEQDPCEVNNLSKQLPEKRDDLFRTLCTEIEVERSRSDAEKEEIAKRLKDFGYL